MKHYKYASKRMLKPVRDEIISLISKVQNDLKKTFTFQYVFVGSYSLNLVTYDPKTNKGFDFDINIIPNDDDENYSPKELKTILINSFNKYCKNFNFDYAENNSRVFTIKAKDKANSKIIYSADFAIVHEYVDKNQNKRQEMVYYNKANDSYSWQEQPKAYYEYLERIKLIKENGLWHEVRELYLEKKNNNTDVNKKSSSLRRETINEVYLRNFEA